MSMRSRPELWIILIAAAMVGLCGLAFDWLVPGGVAGGVIYMLLLMIGLPLGDPPGGH